MQWSMKAWVLLRMLMQSSLVFLAECLTWKAMDSMLLRAGNFGSQAWPLWAVKPSPPCPKWVWFQHPRYQVCTSAVGQATHCHWVTFSHLQTKSQSLYRCFFHPSGHWYRWWFCKMGLFFLFIFIFYFFFYLTHFMFKGHHWYWIEELGVV